MEGVDALRRGEPLEDSSGHRAPDAGVGERRGLSGERQDHVRLERFDVGDVLGRGAAREGIGTNVRVDRLGPQKAGRRRRLHHVDLDLLRIERWIERDLVPRPRVRHHERGDAHDDG